MSFLCSVEYSAFEKFNHEYPASYLYLIGDGPLKNKLLRQVGASEAKGHIIFIFSVIV